MALAKFGSARRENVSEHSTLRDWLKDLIVIDPHNRARPCASAGSHRNAEIAAKSLRKAQTATREAGADNIALVLQGTLVTGDTIAEAGLVQARA